MFFPQGNWDCSPGNGQVAELEECLEFWDWWSLWFPCSSGCSMSSCRLSLELPAEKETQQILASSGLWPHPGPRKTIAATGKINGTAQEFQQEFQKQENQLASQVFTCLGKDVFRMCAFPRSAPAFNHDPSAEIYSYPIKQWKHPTMLCRSILKSEWSCLSWIGNFAGFI